MKTGDPPMMYAEEVEEIDSFVGLPLPDPGFAFYPMRERHECGNP